MEIKNNSCSKYFIVIVQKYIITLDNTKRILVIDDEPDICLVLKIVLESNGFLVNYYYNPILALDEFKFNFYDLIILDIQMPDMNGFQLYREIRKKDKKVKICFLTASETIPDITKEFSEICIFKKPIENNDLVRIVSNLLNN